jgi:hypothetical protein
LRYTYQAPATKTLRIPESQEYTLGSKKGTFREKLGDKIDLGFGPTYIFTPWLSLSTSYLMNHTFKSKYDSNDEPSNIILSNNTRKDSHSIKGDLAFSTVDWYKRGRFMAPLTMTLSAQHIFSGVNVPRYTRVDFEFRLYF